MAIASIYPASADAVERSSVHIEKGNPMTIQARAPQMVRGQAARDLRSKTRLNSMSNSMAKKPRKAIGSPDDYRSYITERPQGTAQLYTKTGEGWVYNWLMGIVLQPCDGSVTEIITSDDGKVYMNNPFSLYSTPGWIEGTIENNSYVFNLPQMVNYEDYGDGEIYEDYCLKLQYGEDEEGPWYFLCEDQTVRFNIGTDGVLTPDMEGMMLGMCNWFDDDDGGYWSWQATGDEINSLTPHNEKTLEVPSTAQFNDWYRSSGINVSSIPIAFDGDKVYIKGIYSGSADIKNSSIVGTYDNATSKITFESGQYLGIDWNNCTVLYFVASETLPNGSNKIADKLVFDYDKDTQTLTTDGSYAICCTPDKLLYYQFVNKPAFFLQEGYPEVTSLVAPVYDEYYPEEPYYGYYAELYFYIPMLTPDGKAIDTSKLYWNVILDDEVFTFMPDEYYGLEEPMTDVPYGYDEIDGFYCSGNLAGCFIIPEGYDSLGFRTLYKDGDKTVYSDIVYVPGFESGIKGISINGGKPVREEYFDLQGRPVSQPSTGFYIRRATYDNGKVITSKIVR